MILGIKTRKHDLEQMLKFNPKILEFHFSDSDLNLQLTENYKQELIIHCFEYFDRKLIDLASLRETNQIHSREKSVELVQKAIEKTISLGKNFTGIPTMILHPGGYSLNESSREEIQMMQKNLILSLKELKFKKINFLLENMPPYAWFFGGRWNCNVFLESKEILNYCINSNQKICYDLCHAHLYCNKNKKSLINELLKIQSYVNHFHLSDGEGVDGEGLQFGEGDLPFEKIIPMLNTYENIGFSIEVWKGHENKGKGFEEFLHKVKEAGLLVK